MNTKQADDDMKLPPGKTCGDCVHFPRCSKIVGAKNTWTNCDFAPSVFQDAAAFCAVVKAKGE